MYTLERLDRVNCKNHHGEIVGAVGGETGGLNIMARIVGDHIGDNCHRRCRNLTGLEVVVTDQLSLTESDGLVLLIVSNSEQTASSPVL